MKRLSFIIFALSFSLGLFAKDIKTVVLKTQPEMHCANCEKKIKENIRFEKGVKSIKTDLKTKTVIIEYDADKTNVQDIIKGFKKIKYEASEVKKTKKISRNSRIPNVCDAKCHAGGISHFCFSPYLCTQKV